MKSKIWGILLTLLFVVCAGLGLWLIWPGEDAPYAQIFSDGKLLYTLDLKVDQTLTIVSTEGENTVTIRDGKIAVTEADCPDHYCMDRGYCSGGVQIVCLPNRLVIRFLGDPAMDGVVG